MGKKGHGKVVKKHNTEPKKLPMQKRNELNQLVDKLLKITSIIPNGPGVAKVWELYEESQRLLDRIQQLESDIKLIDKTRSTSTIKTFTTWCKDNGVLMDNIQISEFPGYELGLEATNSVDKGSLLVAVPKKLMMTVDTSDDSIKSLIQHDKMLQNMPNVSLAFVLIIEKLNAESFWKPYIDVLPEKYNTVLYYGTQDLLELKGSPSLEPALKQCRNIARQYAYFSKLIQAADHPVASILKEKFTFDLYRWAVSTVMTRQNSVPWGPETEEGERKIHDNRPALIPLWDMANHTKGEITTGYNPELQRLESLALKKYDSGDQIFIFYGERSNAELLIHNGFIYPDNPYDSFPLRLGISALDPLAESKATLLNILEIPRGCDLHIVSLPSPISPALLGFARVFNMEEEQLDIWISSGKAKDLLDIDCALDTAVEKKVWLFLQNRMTILLAAYPTSLEDDERLKTQQNWTNGEIAANVLPPKTNNAPKQNPFREAALQLRVSEKRILTNAIEYIKNLRGL